MKLTTQLSYYSQNFGVKHKLVGNGNLVTDKFADSVEIIIKILNDESEVVNTIPVYVSMVYDDETEGNKILYRADDGCIKYTIINIDDALKACPIQLHVDLFRKDVSLYTLYLNISSLNAENYKFEYWIYENFYNTQAVKEITRDGI